MGIGDWGLGLGDWALGPFTNPQSPIPIYFFINFVILVNKKEIKYLNKTYFYIFLFFKLL